MRTSVMKAALVLVLALASSAVLAQPVLWARTFGVAFGSNGPTVQVVSDGAGGVYVGRLDHAFAASVTRLDASGTVLWTVSLTPPLVCIQCTYSFGDLRSDASGVYLMQRTSAIKIGPCGIFCSTISVRKLAASDGASTGVFFVSGPTSSIENIEAFAVGPGGNVAIAGSDYATRTGVLRRVGTDAFKINAGHVFSSVAVGPGGQVVAVFHNGTTPSLHAYAGAGILQWSKDLGNSSCGVLLAGPSGRVVCTRASDIQVFEADGSLAWEAATPGEAVFAAAFDASGNLWLAGGDCSNIGFQVVCTPRIWKRNPAGVLVASDAAPDRGGFGAWNALSIAPNGDVYVASLMVTARYDPTGARQWISAPRGSARESNNLVALDDGAVVGGIDRSVPTHDVTALKLGAAALPAPTIEVSGPASAHAGVPINLTITVAGTPVPAGNVHLYEGTTQLCFAALTPTGADRSSAACTVALGPGQHALTAVYSGSAIYGEASASVPLIVVGDGPAAEVPVLPYPWLIALALILVALASRRLR